MAQDFRRPDSLTRHATVTERVRKLEVMSQTLTVRPAEWQADEELLDLATQLVMGQSSSLNPGVPPTTATSPHMTWMIDRAAQQGLDELMTEGYGYDAAAREWTGLLAGCGAITGTRARNDFAPINPAGIAEEPVPALSGSGMREMVHSGGDAPQGRLHVWTGDITEGTFFWVDAGFTFVTGDDPPTVPDGDPLEIAGVTIWREGGWLQSHTGPAQFEWGMSSDDAQYFVLDEFRDCEAETFPHPLPALGDGQILGPWKHPYACPADPGEHPVSGGTTFGVIFHPDPHVYLACPPLPYRGETVTRTISGGSMPGGIQSYYALKDRVATLLPSFPNVQAWIANLAGRAGNSDRHRWHTILRSPAHKGRIEARVQDRHVLLRGHMRCYGNLGGNEVIATIDSRFVPPPAKLPFYLAVHTPDGRAAVVNIDNAPTPADFPHDYPLHFRNLDGGLPEDEDATELIFDGLAYPTDIPLY